MFLSENMGNVENPVDPRILWNAVKGCIRNVSILFSSRLNKSRLGMIMQLESKLNTLDKEQINLGFSEERQKIIDSVKNDLDLLLRSRAQFQIHRTRRNYYFNSARPSHLLAMRMQKNEKFSNISSITSQQSIITDPKKINNEFRSFYAALYSSEISLDKPKCKQFLDNLKLPSLTQCETSQLSRPITLTDLFVAISGMKKEKSPGWDGIPPEFYIKFWDELGHLFLDMIHSSIEQGSFFNDANQAIIAVLPKPNKDPTLCSSYRPLSILNTEIKVYARALATRVETYMTKLIHNDSQNCFTVILPL